LSTRDIGEIGSGVLPRGETPGLSSHARRIARTDASVDPVGNADYEPREHNRSNEIPLMQPGPPFKLADVILCTPKNEQRQLALVTEATPPTYKLLLQNGVRINTAVQSVHIMPDWNTKHPKFAARQPEPFLAEKQLLLRQQRKRQGNNSDNIDIHRRAKRRRVAFANPPHQEAFVLPSQKMAAEPDDPAVLPPITQCPNIAPPPQPPPLHWPKELVPLKVVTGGKLGGADKKKAEVDANSGTASTAPLDDDTLTTMPWSDDESEWSDASDDENDDQGKPKSLMQPQHLAEVHPFIETLHEWKEGIEVDCGGDWEWSTIEEAVLRGPHPTACTEES